MRAIRILLSVGAVVGLAGCPGVPKDSPSAQHFAKGFKAYQNGDFETAALYLKPLVDNDHPAAQLLMARMYANGQGVTENMRLSEELRNKAALRMYSHFKLKPGQVDPSSEELHTLEKRVDYYVNGIEKGDAAPAPETAALPLPGAEDSSPAITDVPGPTPPLSREPAPADAEAKADDAALPLHIDEISNQELFQETLSVQRISLSNLLTEASSGDKDAARQIALAYRKGFYGIRPDPAQAMVWEKKS